MSRAYYNEIDPKAAAWLRELIKRGLIADGDVDERSITDVRPDDLVGYTQCHFFAGIGGWSYALRLAGWPDDRQVWTGSCPCQPFSCAGKGEGTADHRHLWPEFARLIAACRPAKVFGEQVASKAGRLWLAGVRTDLEAMAYRVGAADLCAAGVGSPHIRQRLYWFAHSGQGLALAGGSECGWRGESEREHRGALHATDRSGISGVAYAERAERRADQQHEQLPGGWEQTSGGFGRGGEIDRLADSEPLRTGNRGQRVEGCAWIGRDRPAIDGAAGGMGNTIDAGLEGHAGHGDNGRGGGKDETGSATPAGAWSDYYIVHCRDGKARRVGAGVAPLAHGVPARVVRLRGYGNAIVPQVAAEFIQACEEAIAV